MQQLLSPRHQVSQQAHSGAEGLDFLKSSCWKVKGVGSDVSRR